MCEQIEKKVIDWKIIEYFLNNNKIQLNKEKKIIFSAVILNEI